MNQSTAWALTMAGYRTQQGITEYGWELVLCAALCTLLHSAACILSDVFDRDFDRQGICVSFII